MPAKSDSTQGPDGGFTPDQIHRIMLEWMFCHKSKELCEKWGISRYRLDKWRKRGSRRPFWTLEDAVIAGIYRGGWHAPADLIGWLDYRDHARHSEEEVRAMFERLEARGEVKRKGGKFKYVQVDPPYVFGPRVE